MTTDGNAQVKEYIFLKKYTLMGKNQSVRNTVYNDLNVHQSLGVTFDT